MPASSRSNFDFWPPYPIGTIDVNAEARPDFSASIQRAGAQGFGLAATNAEWFDVFDDANHGSGFPSVETVGFDGGAIIAMQSKLPALRNGRRRNQARPV